MPVIQKPLGEGQILWLGVNRERGTFSTAREQINITNDGIADDIYRGLSRFMSAHDVDYFATDGTKRNLEVLNHRQITLVEQTEVEDAGREAQVTIEPGMLRENLVVRFFPTAGISFSALPAFSRMVIAGDAPKVLFLTEENGPCDSITGPIGLHYHNTTLRKTLKSTLKQRRGKLAMVQTMEHALIHIGDTFTIYPPM